MTSRREADDPVGEIRLVKFLIQMLLALENLHKVGVIHGALTPSKVVLLDERLDRPTISSFENASWSTERILGESTPTLLPLAPANPASPFLGKVKEHLERNAPYLLHHLSNSQIPATPAAPRGVSANSSPKARLSNRLPSNNLSPSSSVADMQPVGGTPGLIKASRQVNHSSENPSSFTSRNHVNSSAHGGPLSPAAGIQTEHVEAGKSDVDLWNEALVDAAKQSGLNSAHLPTPYNRTDLSVHSSHELADLARYLAPEQLDLYSSETIPASFKWDIYALGAIAYEMVAQEPPCTARLLWTEVVDEFLQKHESLRNNENLNPDDGFGYSSAENNSGGDPSSPVGSKPAVSAQRQAALAGEVDSLLRRTPQVVSEALFGCPLWLRHACELARLADEKEKDLKLRRSSTDSVKEAYETGEPIESSSKRRNNKRLEYLDEIYHSTAMPHPSRPEDQLWGDLSSLQPAAKPGSDFRSPFYVSAPAKGFKDRRLIRNPTAVTNPNKSRKPVEHHAPTTPHRSEAGALDRYDDSHITSPPRENHADPAEDRENGKPSRSSVTKRRNSTSYGFPPLEEDDSSSNGGSDSELDSLIEDAAGAERKAEEPRPLFNGQTATEVMAEITRRLSADPLKVIGALAVEKQSFIMPAQIPGSKMSLPLLAILQKALHPDPSKRWDSAEEMRMELEGLLKLLKALPPALHSALPHLGADVAEDARWEVQDHADKLDSFKALKASLIRRKAAAEKASRVSRARLRQPPRPPLSGLHRAEETLMDVSDGSESSSSSSENDEGQNVVENSREGKGGFWLGDFPLAYERGALKAKMAKQLARLPAHLSLAEQIELLEDHIEVLETQLSETQRRAAAAAAAVQAVRQTQQQQQLAAASAAAISSGNIVLNLSGSVKSGFASTYIATFATELAADELVLSGGSIPLQAIRKRSNDRVDLSARKLVTHDALVLARLIQQSPWIQRLSLANNYLALPSVASASSGGAFDYSLSGLVSLTRSLASLSALTHFDISHNDLGAEGGELVCKALSGCPHLRRVNLSGTNLLTRGARALANALPKLALLEDLCINGASLGPQGMAAVASAMSRMPSLSRLSLYDNAGGEVGGAALLVALQTNFRVVNLSLARNKCPETVEQSVLAAVAFNAQYRALHDRNAHFAPRDAAHLFFDELSAWAKTDTFVRNRLATKLSSWHPSTEEIEVSFDEFFQKSLKSDTPHAQALSEMGSLAVAAGVSTWGWELTPLERAVARLRSDSRALNSKRKALIQARTLAAAKAGLLVPDDNGNGDEELGF